MPHLAVVGVCNCNIWIEGVVEGGALKSLCKTCLFEHWLHLNKSSHLDMQIFKQRESLHQIKVVVAST